MKRLVQAAVVMAVLVISISASAQPQGAGRNGATVARRRAVAQGIVDGMAQAAGARVDATYSRLTGRVVFLSVRGGRGVPLPDPSAQSADDRARSLLRSFGPAFGLGPESDARITRRLEADEVGLEHLRVQQTFKGIPVVAAELMLHLRGSELVAANGKALPDVAVDTTPTIDAEQARHAARELARQRLNAAAVELSEPELQILDRGLLNGLPRPTLLAWFVVARNERLREYVWVDAHRGGVALHFNQNPDVLNRTVYDTAHGSSLPGTLVRSEGQADVGDTDVDNAYRYAGDTYDYYLTQHGRDSYDGAGAELRSTVHYGYGYNNAFWNGSRMVYGDGYPAADDVVGHELTHAVIEHTANLFYYMQSGALNESLSDIFGETIDLTNTGGTDTPAVRWLAGEDTPWGAIRNMMNPPAFGAYLHGDPGKMSDPGFSCGEDGSNADAGGVHTNSGVPNHAYALMVDGGTYNGRIISGIGLTKAAKIQYRTLATYLLSGSDFLDYGVAVRQACTDLVGTDGITEASCAEVGKALDAVEITQPWPCTEAPPEVLKLCPGGETPTDVWFDDFENTTSGRWSTSLLSGTDNHWNVSGWRAGTGDSSLYFSDFAVSGTHHLWGYDQYSIADSTVEMSTGVTLPANARLQFDHAFGFDNWNGARYDGGVIEYCTDACTVWQDAGALISAGAAYNGVLAQPMYRNPLAGRTAFTGASWGYTATQLDLATLGGQSFRLRFRIGSDVGYDDYGWFVDDVRIYQCPPPTPGTVTGFYPDGGPVGTKIAIAGRGFTGATAVEFNGTPAAFEVKSPTSITATVPPGATTGPIRVVTPQGTGTSATRFKVTVPSPTITRFAPTKGPVGTEVTITGANFTGTTAVTFIETTAIHRNASFTVLSATSITATVPAGGTYTLISVTTPGGTATAVAVFETTTTCTTSFSPTRASFGRSGGGGALVVAAPSSCSWSVTSEGSWLHPTTVLSGSGDATVGYAVDPNPGAERDGWLWIAGRPFAVRQQGWLTDIGGGLTGVQVSATAWGDYDNDGDLDLLLTGASYSGRVSTVYRNDGGGVFTDIGAGLLPVFYGAVAWGDYDNDGDLDILLTGYSDPYGDVAKVYRNDDGMFTDVGAALTGVSYSSAAWGDHDNDGDLDILLTGYVHQPTLRAVTKVYRNDGGGVFTDVAAALAGVAYGTAAWGDFDNDGDLEIALVGRSDSTSAVAKVYLNDGGVFTDIGAALAPVVYGSVAWGDYDGDGDLDILLAGYAAASGKNIARVYRNDGGGVFTDIVAALAGTDEASVAWGDFDNDGDLDILVGGRGGTALYRNDGGGLFTDTRVALPSSGWGSIAWGDFDNDGDLDLVMTGLPAFASLYRNDLAATNGAPSAPTNLAATDSGGLVLSWAAASDARTPHASLTYNLRVGTSPGGTDVVSPMAADDGRRRIPALGNVQHGTTARLRLPPGTYYWSVQAVDTAFSGSPFATEASVAYCGYALDPEVQSISDAGGSGIIGVTAGGGCGWTASSKNPAWLTVTSGWSGTGSGTVGYSVATNPGAARTGTLTIGSRTFTLKQAAGPCPYAIDPGSSTATLAGGKGTVRVTTGSSCGWTATSADAWLTVTAGAAAAGNGTVSYSVAANSGRARTGSLTIAGLPFMVTQASGPWHNWFAVSTLETPMVGDFNGDGKTDLITFTRQNPRAVGDVYVALSNGFEFVDRNGLPNSSDKWHDWFAISTDETAVIGDYDGDGRDDIATWLGKTTRQVYVALSYGTGMSHESVWLGSIGFDPSDALLSGDVNGDGRKDLVLFARKQGKVYVARSTGSRFAAPELWHSFFAVSTSERPRVADVNGDGKGDIVTFATNSPTAFGDVYVALSVGTGFVDQNGVSNSSTKWHDWFAIDPAQQIRIGDVNGDHKDDFFTFLPPPFAQCYTVASQGKAMGGNVLWPEAVAPLPTDVPFVGDVNGDDRADIIVFAQSEGKVYVSLGR